MAVKIRLRRMGTTNLAFYRVVVADSRSPRDGRFIEILGHYDPNKDGTDNIVIQSERLDYWLRQGAEISQALRPLLKRAGLLAQPGESATAAPAPAPETELSTAADATAPAAAPPSDQAAESPAE